MKGIVSVDQKNKTKHSLIFYDHSKETLQIVLWHVRHSIDAFRDFIKCFKCSINGMAVKG